MNIRIVEDNPDLSTLYRIIAEQAFEGNVWSDSPIEVDMFNVALWNDIDVAIIDLMLNGSKRTGIEILQWLKLHFPDIKRVVVTAYASEEVGKEALDLADYLLPKPFHIHEIIQIVEGEI